MTSDPGPLPKSVTAEPGDGGLWLCTFRYRPAGESRVNLAGSFNGWNANTHSLADPDGDGVFAIRVPIEAGTHHYKFVLDGSNWISDPQNPDRVPDGFTGYNSVLKLGRLARMSESTASTGDGRIEPLGLEHKPDGSLYRQWLSADRLLLRYRTLSHDVERVSVAIRGGPVVPMYVVSEGPLFSIYETQIRLPQGQSKAGAAPSGAVEYTFILADGSMGVSDLETYRAASSSAQIMKTPEWAKHAVWYQIMVDRFRNGDPANDPQPVRPWTSEWFTPSPFEGKDGATFYGGYVFKRYYGGDLAGLQEKLPYLKDLGINAIYLNPVFKAESHHKYNATNFLHIDDHFGTKGDYAAVAASEDLLDPTTWKWTDSDRRFLQFLEQAHAMGFRVIIDGVFNHVGTAHPAFQDVQKNGKKSRFADWFDVTSWDPFRYNGWAGYSDLPVFKKSGDGLASESVKQHVFAVTRRWMDPNGDGDPSDGIDGWRLDVPNEIPAPFWAEWHDLVKSINADAYISGEIWDRADQWLDGRHFDAVMNYQFAQAAIAWICHRDRKITASEVDRRLADLRMAYPSAATYVMQNLVDSHDTDRLVSMALNPDRDYDRMNRPQDDNPNYDNSKPSPEAYRRARLVALLQMTYVGAPMIYYGDEVGMWGADDPTNRKPMLWSDLDPYEKPEENVVSEDHLDFYKRAIALRHAHPALRTGTFQTLLADDELDVWAFLRTSDTERVLVLLNASETARPVRVPLPTGSPRSWRTVFGDRGDGVVHGDASVTVPVPALGGIVLVDQDS
ncbi:MAG: alpha-glucosidase C-terminal domain-containing protein [Planctomycetes bacterium]|nr:alpha-glucosidase C-terminal domain-containing protein [Planctomycetota bacterium]